MSWVEPEIIHGKPTVFNWLVLYPQNLRLGADTDIGAFTLIACQNGVLIGPGVKIGSHCAIYSKSTIDDKNGFVWLKSGCKIGSHTTIMPGVTVGRGAIVGAHSFVNCDIPDGETWFGVPAKRAAAVTLRIVGEVVDASAFLSELSRGEK